MATTLEESKDFIENLFTTGIKGTVWPKKTYLIVVIKNRRGEVIFRKKYQTLPNRCGFLPNENHTERQMLDDQEFKECLETGEVCEIILTSNYSPCKDCAKDLKNFYEECTELRLTIQFSHPYETNDGKDHLKGLKNLDRAGITLEAMTDESRLDVLRNEEHLLDMVLKFMFDLDPRRVEERDVATKEKLKKLRRTDSEAERFAAKMKNLNL